MLCQFRWIVAVLIAVMAMSLPTKADAASGKGKGSKPGKVEGKLVGVASNGIVIQTKSGSQISLGVTSSTKVELKDVKVDVTLLPIGAKAEAVFDPATSIASKVEVD